MSLLSATPGKTDKTDIIQMMQLEYIIKQLNAFMTSGSAYCDVCVTLPCIKRQASTSQPGNTVHKQLPDMLKISFCAH